MTLRTTDIRSVQIKVAPFMLEGELAIPEDPKGMVIFVHGSGSSRFSPRNQFVAGALQEAGLATLLFDLLTREEEQVDLRTRHLRFDIDLLARRTIGSTEWLLKQPGVRGLNIGYFGASTGAAAALIAAAQHPDMVRAVVSRGGRPDLAKSYLPQVQAPVLLIVGGKDMVVIDLNEQALGKMRPSDDRQLKIVPGATHLFEEPGTLEQAGELAKDWFLKYLR